jgi:hypothetical protein
VPKASLLHEFFGRTSESIVAHRYCDLRFLEYLLTYSRQGNELGLEVHFFEPDAWMYFYSCCGIDEKQWERSIERADDSSTVIGLKGHMSSEVKLEPGDVEVAERVHGDFQVYDPHLSRARLARYWAAFRNTMELVLVRLHTRKLDQRNFDAYVWMAVNGSFFKFAERVNSLPQVKAERAAKMMYRVGQDYAKSMADRFGVGVLWHKPNSFIEPPVQVEQHSPQFHYAPPQQHLPWSYAQQHHHQLYSSPFSQPTYSPFANQRPVGYVPTQASYSPFSLGYPGMYY